MDKLANIFFNVPEVKDYLLEHGFVFSLRKKRRTTGTCKAVTGSYKKWKQFAIVDVVEEMEVTNHMMLYPFVKDSGFLTPERDVSYAAFYWYELARRMSKFKKTTFTLYKVMLKKIPKGEILKETTIKGVVKEEEKDE